VEGITGILFGVVAYRLGWTAELPAVLLFVAGGVALSGIDIDTMRLPTKVVYVTLGLVAGGLLGAGVATGAWHRVAWAVAGSLGASGALLLLLVVSRKGMGMGDIRLALVLGAVTGWYGPGRVALGLFLGFLIGSIVGLTVAARSGQLKGKKIPFGPSLFAGSLVAVLWGASMLHWYRAKMGL
jgi:leader peptidase (prepilin peptidase)/N-methyltransferase